MRVSIQWLKGLVAIAVVAGNAAAGDGFDEDAFFSDTTSLVDSASVVNSASTVEEMKDKKSVGISGDITSAVTGSVTRDFGGDPGFSETRLSSAIVGNLMLDARMLQNFKAFGNLETQYVPDSNKATFSLRELFIDANVSKVVYFRTGKQVLQWGPCYFWNPTDLVNVENKSFVQKLGYREGTYGLKMHVPFGTRANIYGFIDANRAPRIDSLAAAGKVDVLIGGTEVAVSVWDKRGRKPVYGLDFTTQLLTMNVSCELGLHQEYRLKTAASADTGILPVIGERVVEWAPRVCLNVNRSFGFLGVQERVSLMGELYYNHVGLSDETISLPMSRALMVMNMTKEGALQARQMVAGYLIANGVYVPNNLFKWYAAFFGSFGRFITSDMTLTVNGIVNLNQRCATITTGLTYTGLNSFTMGLSINGFVGPDNTEYTLSGDALMVRLTAGVTF